MVITYFHLNTEQVIVMFSLASTVVVWFNRSLSRTDIFPNLQPYF